MVIGTFKKNFSTHPKIMSFLLQNYEGPLDLLLFLVKKEEMDIFDVTLRLLTKQLGQMVKDQKDLETQGDLLLNLAQLLLIKSRKLTLDTQIQEEDAEEEVSRTRSELVEHLLEYCEFRDHAQNLAERAEEQSNYFTRLLPKELPSLPEPETNELQDLSLLELRRLFEKAIAKAKMAPPVTIVGQTWDVSSKIEWLNQLIFQQKKIDFDTLFPKTKCREELIVIFLALLELIKQATIRVSLENEELAFSTYE